MSTIGERLRAARKKHSLTQEKLANLVGVSRITIHEIEKGHRDGGTFEMIVRICRKLDISADWLLGIDKTDGR